MAKKTNPKKNKHLTQEDRIQIEECLNKCMHFKDIAKLIEKDPTTVSYEVKHHRYSHSNSFTSSNEQCPLLLKAPFVCNGCKKRHSPACHFVHYYYRASYAYKEYRTTLSETREGIPLNHQEFYENDRIITEGLKKGQHIYHIMANSDGISCSKSTVYRHFKLGYYSASLTDLPRAVKFKPRKQKKEDYIPKGIKIGRTYDDFLCYIEENHIERHTEPDTVIGRIGGKVILTIHFVCCNFMAALLLDDKTAAQAALKFTNLKKNLKKAGLDIRSTFDVLLADNGGEFADVYSFEDGSPDSRSELKMFFCDPVTPSQKPFIEKNHTLFRVIAPKDSSFDDFSQDIVNLIFSHVNSVSRAIYGGKSAYDMFCYIYSEKIASLLGIKRIPPSEVIQSPLLLKGLVDLNKGL